MTNRYRPEMDPLDAVDFQELLRFALGLPTPVERELDATDLSESAYQAAERLLDRARFTLGGRGLTLGDLEETWPRLEHRCTDIGQGLP